MIAVLSSCGGFVRNDKIEAFIDFPFGFPSSRDDHHGTTPGSVSPLSRR
jgi:hypothetical protein